MAVNEGLRPSGELPRELEFMPGWYALEPPVFGGMGIGMECRFWMGDPPCEFVRVAIKQVLILSSIISYNLFVIPQLSHSKSKGLT